MRNIEKTNEFLAWPSRFINDDQEKKEDLGSLIGFYSLNPTPPPPPPPPPTKKKKK